MVHNSQSDRSRKGNHWQGQPPILSEHLAFAEFVLRPIPVFRLFTGFVHCFAMQNRKSKIENRKFITPSSDGSTTIQSSARPGRLRRSSAKAPYSCAAWLWR